MTDEEKLLNLVKYIILVNEGAMNEQSYVINYSLVEYSTGIGLGLLQWSFSRAFNLLREIYENNGSTWKTFTPSEPLKNAIETNLVLDINYNPYLNFLINTTDKVNAFNDGFLFADSGKNVQDNKCETELKGYIQFLNVRGLTNKKSIPMWCDIINHYGTGPFGSDESSYNDYNFSKQDYLSKFSTTSTGQNFTNRRKRVIAMIESYNWDNPQFNCLSSSPTNTGEPVIPPNNGTVESDDNSLNKEQEEVYGRLNFKMNENFYNMNGNYITNFLRGIKIDIQNMKKEIPEEIEPVPEPETPTSPNTPPDTSNIPSGLPQEYIDTLADCANMVVKGTGIRNGYGYQCLALIWGVYGRASSLAGTNKMFDDYSRGIGGGAYALASQPQSNWHQVSFGNRISGDIIVWGGSTPIGGISYGHIAIIAEDVNSVYEQNANNDGFATNGNYIGAIQKHGMSWDSEGNRNGLWSAVVWRLNGY